MSEKRKKEIHVKDLVIKADNVLFESPEKRDPFFGPRRHGRWDEDQKMEHEEKKHEHLEEDEDERKEDQKDHHDDEHDRRPPFFWI